MAKGTTRARARRIRQAIWAVSLVLSLGVGSLVAAVQAEAYTRMIATSRRQLVGSASGIVRMLNQDIDASLGPLLALRNAVDGPEPGSLRVHLAEVQARHPELPTFVALAADGDVLASTHAPLTDWRGSLAAPRRTALEASVRVGIVAGESGQPPTMRVVVDAYVPEPAAFGTAIDAGRVRDSMRHTMLGTDGDLAVFSLSGRLFATNRDTANRPLDVHGLVPGTTGSTDDGDQLVAWATSAAYPFVARVSFARAAVRQEWWAQAWPAMLAMLALVVLVNLFAAVFDRAYRRQTRLIDALTRTARHLGDVQRTGHIGLWEADLRTGDIVWSGQVHEITGCPRDFSLVRRSTYVKLVHPEDQPGITAWLERFGSGDGPFDFEHRLCRPDGGEVRVNLRAARITNEEGQPILAGTICEVTALHEARRRLETTDRDLAASEAAYRQLLAGMPLPLAIVRDGRIEFANLRAEERLGSVGETLVGREAAAFMDRDAMAALSVGSVDGVSATAWLNPDHGMPFEAELALSDYRDAHGRGTLVIIRDITEQRRYEERLNHQATHDELTGLPNRRALRERLDELVTECVRDGTGLMVLFIDLDHFKVINDALGHALGDQVLRDVTLRLGDALHEAGHVGRFGGDEFVAMVPFTGLPVAALDVLPRVQRAIEEPMTVGGSVQRLKCSIGVAFATRDGTDADTLIRNADTAMYVAKRSGRHTWKRYAADMHATAMARLTVATRLSGIHLDNELSLAWQTQHAGDDGRVTGVEALLRWPSGPAGLTGADQLIPLLEETGAIVQIGHWVLREACRHQRRLLERLGPGCRVAVNISAQQLMHGDLVGDVRLALAETGASAYALELELTESAFMQDPERAIRTLDELRAMGVSIALDDFGTGYSNLTYLSRLPLDKLKIDRHFTASLLDDEVDASICRSIVFLARSLNLEVVAEGVETDCQRDWLLAEGCVSMQGYLFARPAPIDAIGTHERDPMATGVDRA